MSILTTVVIMQIGININSKALCTPIIIIMHGKDRIVTTIIIDLTIAIQLEVKAGMRPVEIIGIIKDNLSSHILGF